MLFFNLKEIFFFTKNYLEIFFNEKKNNIFLITISFFFIIIFYFITKITFSDLNLNFFFLLFMYIYLFSNIFSYVFKYYLGFYGVFLLNTVSNFFFFLFCILNLNFFFIENKTLNIQLFKWFFLAKDQIIFFEFFIDFISFSFILLTTSISFFVNLFIFAYFKHEPYINRLISLINSFVLSMLILVSAGNLIIFFLGWELIGLTSFFLINFWSERPGTFKSAFKAFSFNKISDASVLISCIIIYFLFNELSFDKIFNLVLFKNFISINVFLDVSLLDICSFFFLLASFIKSAQIFFHVWLPDSMEAPVPASALIHSATLVSAGVYLILRFYCLLEFSFYFHLILPVIGSLTAFVGGVGAVFQTDLKKILAYSTISHCGFLIFLCNFGNFKYVLFYLFIHGFFKAASFLCVGNIIHFSKNYQDLRRMGFLYKYLPVEFFFLSFCLFNLSGLPFFFGFYIKNLLFISYDFFYIDQICFSLIFLSCLTGLFYSYNIIFFSFFDFKKGRKEVYFSNNHLNFKSKFYSNTTLASNIAIFCLIIYSYLIIFFLFYVIVLESTDISDFYIIFEKNTLFFYNNFDYSFLYNFKLFYWIVIIFVFMLFILSIFKKIKNLKKNLIDFYSLITFGFFFF